MSIKNRKNFLKYILAFLSVIVILDFSFSEEESREILSVVRERQSHNNASGNHHYTYRIRTDKKSFYVSQELATMVGIGKPILMGISPIFREVNYVEYNSERETYSLRWFSGLIVPILAVITVFLNVWKLFRNDILEAIIWLT
jgi:hypothetical protein